ncbi:MAG: peptidase dimerization domain-containing protein [Planctomycetes bacterium]|nr:peptidase dimerization domain-containing protein [Planctomycetota bacterium]
MSQTIDAILPRLAAIQDAVRRKREMLLANLVMMAEQPAPTFDESNRVRFLADRFVECGIQSTSIDEAGNGVGVVPGAAENEQRNILIVAHADTIFDRTEDHTVHVREDRVVGAGVADNSLGMAVLATLPTLLDEAGIRLDSNLVLLGTTRSLGRGDVNGLRFFLDNAPMPIGAAVCVEGIELGRLSYTSLGMVRGEITVEVPEVYDWTRFGASSAILILNDVINAILGIPLPRKPRTSILFGSVNSGTTYNTIATHASLRFEIRSESSKIVHDVSRRIGDIAAEISAQSGAEVALDVIARREPGGVPFGHGLVRSAHLMMEALNIEPHISPSMSELSVLIARHIPAVTLGITRGEHRHTRKETVFIEPMYTGLAQLIGLIAAIDGGMCHEE